MATRTRGPNRLSWKQRALKRVQNILATLPVDATDKQKRLALRSHTPSRYVPATERKAWQAAVRDVLGPARKPKEKPPINMLALLDTHDEILNGLLAGYRDNPTDGFRRFVIADRLDELGQEGRARLVRAVKPKVHDVAFRVWPGSRLVHHTLNRCSVEEVHSKHGGFLMSVRDLCDMMERRTLLVDPVIAEATEIERALAVLRLFQE